MPNVILNASLFFGSIVACVILIGLGVRAEGKRNAAYWEAIRDMETRPFVVVSINDTLALVEDWDGQQSCVKNPCGNLPAGTWCVVEYGALVDYYDEGE